MKIRVHKRVIPPDDDSDITTTEIETDVFNVSENRFNWLIRAIKRENPTKERPFFIDMYGTYPEANQSIHMSDTELLGYTGPAFTELEVRRRMQLLADEAHLYGTHQRSW